MPDAQIYLGTLNTWKRVRKAVKAIEGSGQSSNTGGGPRQPDTSVIHVKLTSAVDATNKPGVYYGRTVTGKPDPEATTGVDRLGGKVAERDNAVVFNLSDMEAGANSVTVFDDDSIESGPSEQVVKMSVGDAPESPFRLLVLRKATTGVRVKITGSATGGGKYTGKLWKPPATDVATTGSLAESDLGAEGDDVLILNTREVGKTTHDLASSGYLPLIFAGQVLRTNADGTKVVMVDGLQWEDCT